MSNQILDKRRTREDRNRRHTTLAIVFTDSTKSFSRVVIGSLNSILPCLFKCGILVLNLSITFSIDGRALNSTRFCRCRSRVVFETKEASYGGTPRVSTVFGGNFREFRIDFVEGCVEDLRNGSVGFFAKVVEEVLCHGHEK